MSDIPKVLVYQYEDEITYSPPVDNRDIMKALKIHHVGDLSVNIVKNGVIIENPKITELPNYFALIESSYHLGASTRMNVLVKIYSDGSKELEIKK